MSTPSSWRSGGVAGAMSDGDCRLNNKLCYFSVLDKRNNDKATGYRALLQEFRQLMESDRENRCVDAIRRRFSRPMSG